MRGFRRLGAYVTASIAGVAGAHVAAYVVAFPHAHERAEHLQATGHSYWPAAGVLAWTAAVGTIGLAIHAGHQRASGHRPGGDLSVGRLASFQLALFAGIEVVERLAAGAPLAELVHGARFFVGLVVQVAVAMLVCRLFRTVVDVAERVSSRRRAIPRVPVAGRFHLVLDAGFESRPVNGPVGSRAPPSLFVA